MIFPRLASAFALAACVAAAHVSHLPVARAEVEVEVTDVLRTVLKTTEDVLPQITNLAGDITEDAVLPLLDDLVNAVKTATSSLGGISVSEGSENTSTTTSQKRETKEDVAELLTDILSDVSNALGPISSELNNIAAVAELLKTLDPILAIALRTAHRLLPGVLELVGGPLADLVDVLHNIGLISVLSVLGL